MKFTDAKLRSLKPKDERYEVWEDNGRGLGMRIAPTGRKSFIYMYRYGGRARRMTLGKYPAMSLAAAHEEHGKAWRLVHEQGQDPGELKRDIRHADLAAPTVRTLGDIYVEKYAKSRKATWREDQRILNTYVYPALGSKKAKDVIRRDVIELLDTVKERPARVQANRTHSVIRKMFNWAVSQDLLPYSPCQGVEAPSMERARDRVLSEEEIRLVWTSDSIRPRRVHLALKFALVTAQRIGEVATLQWKDIKGGWWEIPPERTKNRHRHRVPLTPLAECLLQSAASEAGSSPWVFPARNPINHCRTNEMAMSLKKACPSTASDWFTPHDLRRTAATRMAALKVDPFVLSKILNHTEGGVTKIYNRYGYDDEKRAALTKWSEKLSELVALVE